MKIRLSVTRPGTILIHAIALLLIVTLLSVRIRLLSIPLERDEGEFAYMGQLLLKGISPYTIAYTMKLPGVAFVYALFLSIFGQSTEGIRVGLTLINTACAGLVYLLARQLFNRETAIIAAAFYAALSLSQTVLGTFAHATHLVVFFSLAGVILLKSALQKQQLLAVFGSGLCFGLAILMKQHAAIMILFALIFQIWQQPKHNGTSRLKNGFTLLTGTATPYAVVALWLFNAGVFGKFWFWTVQYAREYATGVSLSAGLIEFTTQFGAIFRLNFPVYLLAAAGAVYLICSGMSRATKLFFSGYLAASCIMVSQGLYFRPHYFVLILPAVSIMAGYAVTTAEQFFPGRKASFLPVLLLVTATGWFLFAENEYLFRMTPVEISRRINGTNPFPEALTIGKYLRSQTTKDDRIAVFGSEPEILFYADRLSATGHIYMYGLMEKQRYAEEMQLQMIREVEETAPRFIVIINNPTSWLLQSGSVNRLLAWSEGYISLRYEEVGLVDISGYQPTRYIWGAETAAYEPESDSYISIFRRKW